MTTTSSAQSGPVSKFKPPRELLSHSKSDYDNPNSLRGLVAQDPDDEPEQPAKRRKIELPSNFSTSRSLSSWSIGQTGDNQKTELSRGPWRFSVSFLASLDDSDPTSAEPLPPLPTRPWQHQRAAKLKEGPKLTSRVRKNIPIPNTPDKLEIPGDAPKLGKTGLAGFLPWNGKHPEDVLSEPNIRHGYFDRPPNPPEKEAGSARNALFGAFKDRSGLDTLSVLFGLALDRRSRDNAPSSASNFRPPPRVTLTEAKRKAWFADLANAQVPLRKLSRTIPQGIRGSSLLEQCLSNAVPISRAVWFIKCVGANEIRTLKRKGPGGAVTGGSEIKWLKEWTSFIGQFLESISQQPHHSERNKSTKYALRLTWQLYSENLLDRDSFLDWILTDFATADHGLTPFPLLLVRIYLPDLTRFRRRSQKLAAALVEKFDVARKAAGEMTDSLTPKLRDLIRAFATSRPVCFVMPDSWPACKEALNACLDLTNADTQKLFRYIEIHNQNTAASIAEQSKDTSTPQQAVIRLLDSSQGPFHAKLIMRDCLTACPDVERLILIILKWATSKYRNLPHCLYLAVRILRMLARDDHDIEGVVFAFASNLSERKTRITSLHHLLAELSRSQTISISKYLQSMIVRGSPCVGSFESSALKLKKTSSLGSSEIEMQTCNDTSQILTEISLQHLPDYVRSLRKRILSRAGFCAETEDAVIHHCEWFLSRKFSLANNVSGHADDEIEYSVPPWSSLSWTVKCEISAWIRRFVKAQCKDTSESMQPFKTATKFRTEDFYFIREILESMEDLATLADVVNLVSTNSQESLLASAIDTMNRHSSPFSAMGAFNDLQEKVCAEYFALKSSKLPMTALTISLIDLISRYPFKGISINLLQRDLIQGDRGNAAAACSPFSDGVAESLQQAGSHFFDDFEAILQTETNMNEQTMTKLFKVLTGRIEKQNMDGEHLGEFRGLCHLLTRLRACRSVQGDRLMKNWIVDALSQGEWVTTTALLVDLVGSSCLRLETVMSCVREVTTSSKDYPRTLGALAASLFTSTDDHRDPFLYRFDTERLIYLSQHPLDALDILTKMTRTKGMDSAIQHISRSAIHGSVPAEFSLARDLAANAKEQLQHEAVDLLGAEMTRENTMLDGKDIVTLADDFSYPTCNLSLRLQISNIDDTSIGEVSEAFFSLAANSKASEPPDQRWVSLLSAAGPEVTCRVRARAEEAFFTSLPTFLQGRGQTGPPDISIITLETVTRYLDIAFAASGVASFQISSTLTAQLIEKFSIIYRMLFGTVTSVVSPIATATPIPGLGLTPVAHTPNYSSNDGISAVSRYLPLLLRMTCLQRSGSHGMAVPLSKAAQQDQIKLTVLLTSLGLHPALTGTGLPFQTFAVVATLITQPHFTEEMHAHCGRLLRGKMSDPRVVFLFGSVGACGSSMIKDVGEGLQLNKDGVGRLGEWKHHVRSWEVIEPSGGGEGSSWIGLGLFEAKKIS